MCTEGTWDEQEWKKREKVGNKSVASSYYILLVFLGYSQKKTETRKIKEIEEQKNKKIQWKEIRGRTQLLREIEEANDELQEMCVTFISNSCDTN